MNNKKIQMLRQRARQIRRSAIESIYHARSGHPGGCLSAADILAVLYFDFLTLDPQQPKLTTRDRFILSKGHACPALYAALAHRGFFDEAVLAQLRHLESPLQGHPDVSTPGIDAPSGSLGMGLSQGLGMALAAKYTQRSFQTVVLLGDGDMQEGNTWEAMMAAGHHQVPGLIAIYDANGMQGDDWVEKQMNHLPMLGSLEALGWHTQDIDGHDIQAIGQALAFAKGQNRPCLIHANTVKGKGVQMMENSLRWHGSVEITEQELKEALSELSSQQHEEELENEFA